MKRKEKKQEMKQIQRGFSFGSKLFVRFFDKIGFSVIFSDTLEAVLKILPLKWQFPTEKCNKIPIPKRTPFEYKAAKKLGDYCFFWNFCDSINKNVRSHQIHKPIGVTCIQKQQQKQRKYERVFLL